jgi:hypothetical protein
MKSLKVDSKIICIVIFIIFSIQTILIAHRNSFSHKLIFNFYKENAGLQKGIKNTLIINIIELIKKNKLTSFKLEKTLLDSRKIKQRVFEGAYPARYKKESIYLITNQNIKENCTLRDKINDIYLFKCE